MIAAGVPLAEAVPWIARSAPDERALFDEYNVRNATEEFCELEWE